MCKLETIYFLHDLTSQQQQFWFESSTSSANSTAAQSCRRGRETLLWFLPKAHLQLCYLTFELVDNKPYLRRHNLSMDLYIIFRRVMYPPWNFYTVHFRVILLRVKSSNIIVDTCSRFDFDDAFTMK